MQVKLVLHVGNRQEEVVNNSETDKNKFFLLKRIITIYRFGDFSQRPLCSWTRSTQKCDNSSPPSRNMRSIHNVKTRSLPSPLCSTKLSLSTCFLLLYERVLSELMFFEQVSLGWEDEEGDVVTISSEEELEYARALKQR